MLHRTNGAAVLISLLCLGAACTARQVVDDRSPAEPSGLWQGIAQTPGGALGLQLELEQRDSGMSGTFRIPSEGVDIAAADITRWADSLVVVLTPQRRIRGRLAGDSIVGVLELGDRALPARFGRAGSPAGARITEELDRQAADERAPLVETARGPMHSDADPDALERLLRRADAAGTHSLIVLRSGIPVGSWHADGEPRRIELMSVTKSVVNLAVGRLLTTGVISSIDDPVYRYFPEWQEDDRAQITIRHLLNHTSGLASPPPAEIYDTEDFVSFALASEISAEPGSQLTYNNSATNLLAGLVGRAAGRPIDEMMADEVFAPLGIRDFRWSRDDSGNPHGMAGLSMYADDLAAVGQLVLQRGAWNGAQLIDEDWFDESLRPGSNLDDDVGLLWWLIRDDGDLVGYRADGYLGQYLVIYPKEEIVGVRLVASSAGYDPETDGFREFQRMLRDLVPHSQRGGY